MRFLPARVRVGQVIGLLSAAMDFGEKALDLYKLADEMNLTAETLIPILRAAQVLHLVNVSKGDIHLTKTGVELAQKGLAGLTSVRDILARTEPFYTALSLAKKGPFTPEELAAELSSNAAGWVDSDYTDAAVLKEMLVDWGIYTKLVSYDGEGVFGEFLESRAAGT